MVLLCIEILSTILSLIEQNGLPKDYVQCFSICSYFCLVKSLRKFQISIFELLMCFESLILQYDYYFKIMEFGE